MSSKVRKQSKAKARAANAASKFKKGQRAATKHAGKMYVKPGQHTKTLRRQTAEKRGIKRMVSALQTSATIDAARKHGGVKKMMDKYRKKK